VLAYSLTYPSEFWAAKDRPGCAPADGYLMKEDIQAARTQGADLVIVCCHWGQEKHTKLRYYQPALAHLAIDAGADAVVGHHPHIWQGLEVYKGKPIAYAIGNFAFGTLTSIKDSGILDLTFDEKGNWVGGRILPINVYNHQVAFTPRPMDDKEALKFYLYLKGLSKTAELRLVKDDISEIRWTAPEDYSRPKSVEKEVPLSPTPTHPPLPTPTEDPAGNPEGSVPGAH
jgi:poly-gamma-glutamate synthesis protein (capsule biosynthesis protein)